MKAERVSAVGVAARCALAASAVSPEDQPDRGLDARPITHGRPAVMFATIASHNNCLGGPAVVATQDP